jgi:hypothetical protein
MYIGQPDLVAGFRAYQLIDNPAEANPTKNPLSTTTLVLLYPFGLRFLSFRGSEPQLEADCGSCLTNKVRCSIALLASCVSFCLGSSSPSCQAQHLASSVASHAVRCDPPISR